MNFAYYRESNDSVDKVVDRVKSGAKSRDIQEIGEINLPNKGGKILMICHPEWASKILKEDKNLLAFIPCSIFVTEKNGKTIVGISNPDLVSSVAHLHELHEMLEDMAKNLRSLVDESAAVGPLVASRVKVYATKTCPYCKMEKSYLDEKGVKHDYILVDEDQKAGQEMVEKTGQMGVPVTEVQFDDGSSEFVIGFDRGKINSLLGIK